MHFIDNVVKRSEGSGVFISYGSHDVIYNNHFEEIGHPFARAIHFSGLNMVGQTISRNRIHTDGAGAIGQLWGSHIVAEYNHVTNSGLLIIDNQGIGGGKPTSYTTMQYNWLHDSFNLGIRYDAGEDGLFPTHNNAYFNLAFRNLQGI